MTLIRYLFEGATSGTDATPALTGAVTRSLGGGTIKFAAAAANNGNCGLECITTTNTQYTISRHLANAANNQMAFAGVFSIAASSTADTTIGALRQSLNDTFILRFNVNSSNAFRLVDSASANISATTYTITPGTRYRIEVVLTGGSTTAGVVNAHLYTATGTSPLASWSSTTANLTANTPNGGEFGICSANQAMTVRWDDLQFNDGASSEIGPYNPSVSPLTCSVAVSPSSGTVPFLVTATATAGGGTGVGRTFSFDWGDGGQTPSQSSNIATHTYSAAGSWTVTATVSEPA